MAVTLAYQVVDVFSERPLAGNAVCVVLDACPESLMAGIAREVQLSETTFPTLTATTSYDVRIFAPSIEMPFAGHPSLGTAWVLAAGSAGRWTQTSPGATVTVDVDADGARMQQPPPILTQVKSEVATALGLSRAEGCWVGEASGLGHLIVATDDPLEGLTPDLGAVAAEAVTQGATTVAAVRRKGDSLLHVRVFVPGAGIPEDPGTGSAAGPIATMAHTHWGTSKAVTIHQGDEIGRPCRIEVELGPDGPIVGGGVAACAEGRFTL